MEGTEGCSVDLLGSQRGECGVWTANIPCKMCVHAMPLCHWPAPATQKSLHGPGADWMNEFMCAGSRRTGVMIVTPVHWYQRRVF